VRVWRRNINEIFRIILCNIFVIAEEPKVVYKKKTEIDFEGVEVEGTLTKPQGSLLLERKHAKFNPMIKLRTDFDDEMEQSVKEVK
jgi:hypothetical protein